MIKDTELKKGNLLILNVNYKEVIHRVDEIYTDEVKVTSIEDNSCFPQMALRTCTPIPLTPDWLERCGFVDNGSYWEYKGEPGFALLKDKELNLYIGNPARTYVKTVHNLQNLYFALTEGVELKIEL
jgi:hypothetical protein